MSLQTFGTTLFAFLLPRPRDLWAKGLIFWYGFGAAFVTIGLRPEQLRLLNMLYGRSHIWTKTLEVPEWAIWGVGLAYFVVEEVLLQQAKLLWDDVKDSGRDKILLTNKGRPIARGVMSKRLAEWHVAIRWLLALILGYLFGGFLLAGLFVVISLHQMLYFFCKPLGAKHPVLLLYFLSLSILPRFLAGVMAIAGTGWPNSALVLLSGVFYFNSFGVMAGMWRMEAEYYSGLKVRAQSDYYEKNGAHWQHMGFLTAILVVVFLYSTGILKMDLDAIHLAPNAPYSEWVNRIAVVLYVIVVSVLSTLLILRILKRLVPVVRWTIPRSKCVTILLFVFAASSMLIGLAQKNISWLYGGFLLQNAACLLMFERMTYTEYANADFWNLCHKRSE